MRSVLIELAAAAKRIEYPAAFPGITNRKSVSTCTPPNVPPSVRRSNSTTSIGARAPRRTLAGRISVPSVRTCRRIVVVNANPAFSFGTSTRMLVGAEKE
jgi:hypothetical protein